VSTLRCVQAGGQTAYANALDAAKAELDAHGRPGVQKVIVILSDGAANTGPTYLSPSSPYRTQPCQTAVNIADQQKSDGVLLYSIAYDLGGVGAQDCGKQGGGNESPPILANEALQEIASPGNYYAEPQPSSLTGIFLAISADLGQHFYDFTAVLVMLLCLFLPESTTADLEARAGRRSPVFAAAVAVCGVLVVASVLPATPATDAALRVLPFVAWFPFAVWVVVRVARGGLGPSRVPMRMPGAVAGLLVALVVLNGLTPYLEVKTAYGWNMYANLRTVAGDSNHLVVRSTLPLTDVQDHLLTVVRSDAPELSVYAEKGYLVPERNLLDYLARHPSASVVVSDGGVRRTLDGSDGVRLPLLAEKFQLFRAVDVQTPPRCQDVWLPAH
jgi:hypothetical protein